MKIFFCLAVSLVLSLSNCGVFEKIRAGKKRKSQTITATAEESPQAAATDTPPQPQAAEPEAQTETGTGTGTQEETQPEPELKVPEPAYQEMPNSFGTPRKKKVEDEEDLETTEINIKIRVTSPKKPPRAQADKDGHKSASRKLNFDEPEPMVYGEKLTKLFKDSGIKTQEFAVDLCIYASLIAKAEELGNSSLRNEILLDTHNFSDDDTFQPTETLLTMEILNNVSTICREGNITLKNNELNDIKIIEEQISKTEFNAELLTNIAALASKTRKVVLMSGDGDYLIKRVNGIFSTVDKTGLLLGQVARFVFYVIKAQVETTPH